MNEADSPGWISAFLEDGACVLPLHIVSGLVISCLFIVLDLAVDSVKEALDLRDMLEKDGESARGSAAAAADVRMW